MRYLITIWLFRILRFGSEAPQKFWKNKILSGSENSDSGVIIWGGLSANAAQALIQIARLFYNESDRQRDVWCLNIIGHTGRFHDFTMTRAWHWIRDAYRKLTKMIHARNKGDILLVGHSTGALIVLSLLVWFQIRRLLFLDKDRQLKFKAALLFPAFRLKSRLDESMLFIVALLYYVFCPLIFIYLGITSVKFLPLSGVAIVLHFLLVPRIWIPSGDIRSPNAKKCWWMISELMLLSSLCIFFVTMPVVIILIHRILPAYSQTVMALFIISLLSVLFLIPQKKEA